MFASAGSQSQGESTRIVLRVLGVIVALGIALLGRFWLTAPEWVSAGTWLLVLGCVSAAVLAGRPTSQGESFSESAQPLTLGPRRRLGGPIALLGFGLFAYTTWALFTAWQMNFDWAAPTMVLGVALTSAGLALLDRPWRTGVAREHVTTTELAILAAIFLLACFLRFYKIDYFPPLDGFVAIEEPQSGQGAWAIMRGVRPWEFLLDRWIAVPFFHWMGVSILSLRIPFVIVSCLTVLATYVLLRELVRWPAALFGTFLLAVSHWHLHYARLAHNIFPTTLLSVVVWWLCIRQARTGGVRLYPWIGFWSGYALYAYAGYRGIPVVVALFLLGQLAVLWRKRRESPSSLRALKVHLAGLALVGVFFAGPALVLVNQLRSNPAYFLEAFYRSYANKQYYVSDWPTWLKLRWERQVQTARIFHHFGDAEQAYNLPGEPMLDPVSGVWFTAGLFFCLLYPLRRFQGFFAFAFLFLLIAGATLTQTLVVARLQIVVPLVFVLVALFADRVWQLVEVARYRWAQAVWVGVVVLSAGAAFALNWDVYFGKIIHSPVMRAVYRNYYTTAITYLHSLPDDAYLLALSDMGNLFMPSDYEWWRGERVPGSVVSDIYPVLVGKDGPWKNRQLYLLIQRPFEQQEIADLIRTYLPQAECQWIRHPEGYPHLDQIGCALGRNPVPRALRTSLRARYFRGEQEKLVLERDEPVLSWALSPEPCSRWRYPEEPPCRAEWSGTFLLSTDGPRDVAIEARNAHVEGTIDDRAILLDRSVPIEGYVLEGEMSAQRLSLPPGEHRIELRARGTRAGELGVRLRVKDPVAGWRLISFATAVENSETATARGAQNTELLRASVSGELRERTN